MGKSGSLGPLLKHRTRLAQYSTENMVTLRADPSGQVEQGAWEVGSLRACGWCYLWVCSFGQVSKNLRTSFVWVAPPPGPPGSPPPRAKIQEVMPPSHRASHRTATNLPFILESSILDPRVGVHRHQTHVASVHPPWPPLPPPAGQGRAKPGLRTQPRRCGL
jgi:hypothetical protein